MIDSVTITNHLGESVTLELRFPEKSGFLVRDIDGFDPPKATINSTEISMNDGSVFNSSKLTKRNIVFNLVFYPSTTIEETRYKCYKYFPIGKEIKIQVKTDNREAYIYGHVESNEINIFSKEEGAIISVICHDPYFYSVTPSITLFSGVTPLFEFPFSNESTTLKLLEFGDLQSLSSKNIIYPGDISIGFVMSIRAYGGVTDISITNTRTQQAMIIDSSFIVALTGSDIISGDEILISTIKRNKFIYLKRAGVTYNILNSLQKPINWFTLVRGDNVFAYTAVVGAVNLYFQIENSIVYEGV